MTLEGCCVARADRIAYINHDIDDALRAGVLQEYELPKDCLKTLGQTHGERIETMICDIVKQSAGKKELQMSPLIQEATDGLRAFLFDKVYRDSWRRAEENKCDHVIRGLFSYYTKNPGEMPLEYIEIAYQEGTERAVIDFISGMTDRYAVRCYTSLFLPDAFSGE